MIIQTEVQAILASLKAAEAKTVADLKAAGSGLLPKIQVFVRVHGLSVGLAAGVLVGAVLGHLL